MESKLKKKREEAGLSQYDLALASGVSWRMIQHYEQGRKDINKAQILTVMRLAEALDCDVQDIVDIAKDTSKKEYLVIRKWEDKYNGAAIYSLVDQDGKRYIGQARHLQERLEQHRQNTNKVIRTKNRANTTVNTEMSDAIVCGKRFYVDVLRKIDPLDVTTNKLNFWENHYITQFGGLDGTYNEEYEPVYWSNEYKNEIILSIDFDKIEDADLIKQLEEQEDTESYIKQVIRDYIKKHQ